MEKYKMSLTVEEMGCGSKARFDQYHACKVFEAPSAELSCLPETMEGIKMLEDELLCDVKAFTMGTTVATVWECTPELRWLSIQNTNIHGEKWAGDTTDTLQQAWVSNTGEVEWRDVPIVKEL